MAGQIESLLEKGIQAARHKDRKRAQDILTHVIELDQYNEKAWLWLSSVVEAPADKEVCLENALLINPDNTYAAMGLQHMRQQDRPSPPSVLPRLAGERTSRRSKWAASKPIAAPPNVRVCPRCGFNNPGWAYLCDRCGTNLRQENLKEVLREASRPRGRYAFTLIEAWGGAFAFVGSYAFRPEVALASWGRSIAALMLGAILASVIRFVSSIIVSASAGGYNWRGQFISDATMWGRQALLLVMAMALLWIATTLPTWAGAGLLGGRQNLKTHAHLISVAISAWTLLAAVVDAIIVLMPYLVGRPGDLDLPEQVLNLIGIAVGAIGFIWLAQATREAQGLSAIRGILAAVLAAVLGAILFFSLDYITGGLFASSVAKPLLVILLPWIG